MGNSKDPRFFFVKISHFFFFKPILMLLEVKSHVCEQDLAFFLINFKVWSLQVLVGAIHIFKTNKMSGVDRKVSLII